jgi:hypothetical protein
LGLSTRYIADLVPSAKVIAVDHWRGSPEHHRRPEIAALLPTLYDTFLVNCWEYQDRIFPLRMTTKDGLETIHQYGLQPDVIYIDADHAYEATKGDVELARTLFPTALIVGDDWDWEGVRRAVIETAGQSGLKLETHGVAWLLRKD